MLKGEVLGSCNILKVEALCPLNEWTVEALHFDMTIIEALYFYMIVKARYETYYYTVHLLVSFWIIKKIIY